MKICKNCFNDIEIANFIELSTSTGTSMSIETCEVCGNNKCAVIDLEELSDYFVEFLGLFKKDDAGIPLIEIIKNDWNTFATDHCANIIISEISRQNCIALAPNDKVAYIDDIQECLEMWENIKKEVRKKFRYFTDIDLIETYKFESNYEIKPDRILYRARLLPEGKTMLPKEEMGCPPPEKATAGRANPIGIPYLYLCESIDTTFYETRSGYLDKIVIGEFCPIRKLNLIDFGTEVSLSQAYFSPGTSCDMVQITKYKLLFAKISQDLSKPLRRYDTEMEYVHTQLICEYCKKQGLDGIRFNSSLHIGGKNIVLFDEKDAKCTNVLLKEIQSVTIISD